MDNSKQRKIGILLSYISIIVSTLIQLLYTPLLIRQLGQSEYGLYSLVSSIIGYLTILDLGFGNAIVVYTAKYNQKGEEEKALKMQGMFKLIFLLIGLIAIILGLVLYFNVNNIFGNTMTTIELSRMKTMMLILTFNLGITFPFSIYSAVITAFEKFTFLKVVSILNTLIKPIIMIPLLFLGFKSIAMCIVITIVNVVILLTNYFYCSYILKNKIKYKGFDKVIFKVIFSYSIWIFLNVIVDKVNWSLDQFILGAVSGTLAVSVYSVASQINSLFVNLSGAISGVMLPKVSKMVASDVSTEELTNEMIKVGRLQFYIIFLLASGFLLIGRDFINIWAGKEYKDSFYVAILLILPACVPLIQNLAISICQAMNKHKFRAYITTAMAFVNAILSYFLAKKFGPIGSAIGTTFAIIVCNIIILNIYYHNNLKLNMIKFWSNIGKIFMPLFGYLMIIGIVKYLIDFGNLWNLLFYGFIYTIGYFIISVKYCANDYESNIIKKLNFRKKVK